MSSASGSGEAIERAVWRTDRHRDEVALDLAQLLFDDRQRHVGVGDVTRLYEGRGRG